MDEGKCRECGNRILWVRLVTSGKRMPVDPHDGKVPRRSLVCVNPKTGTGKVLADKDLVEAWKWQEAGAEFHLSHFFTCKARQNGRKKKAKPKPPPDPDRELQRVLEKFPELDH